MSLSLISAARATLCALLLLLAVPMSVAAEPLDNRFTYQGELRRSGVPANGSFDFEFQPFDAASSGNALASAQVIENVVVANGVFSVELDFGATPFRGDKVWLDVGVREGTSTGGFTGLLPRQALTAAPYALHARSVSANSVGASAIDSSQVQRRVNGSCAVGTAIASIRADGSVTCNAAGDAVVFKVRGQGFAVKDLPAGPSIEADIWEVVALNFGGGYNPTTRRFVAPSAGYYYLHANVVQSNNTSNSFFQIGFNVSGSIDYARTVDGTETETSVSGIFRLSAGQEVWVRMRNYTTGSTTRMDGTGSWFEGFKISD